MRGGAGQDGGSLALTPHLLLDLAAGAAIERPVAVVAAHPDDELLGLGAHLHLLRDLRIVHLTDGAPRDLADARRAGCADAAGYAALRRDELRAALAVIGADRAGLRRYDHPDKEAVDHLADIAARLEGDLAGLEAVFTHPYEGGHPDHDTAALAVALARSRLAKSGGGAPAIFEFASYQIAAGSTVYGRFWPDPAAPEILLPLDEAARARKRAALACFQSQAPIIAPFPLDAERVRPAPAYDFTAPPPPGTALYDLWGWSISSHDWRRRARAMLAGEGNVSEVAAVSAS